MKIVLAIDSFKESMTSLEAAEAFKKGFSRVLRNASFVKTSVSDGGEGFTESFLFNRGGRIVKAAALDPLGRKIFSSFGLFDAGKKAVVEMAKASGLMLLKPAERNPAKTTTYGTGQLIDAALRKGVRELVVGIGGSATNDGGLGMAQALGLRFFDKQGVLIKAPASGADLVRVGRIDLGTLPARLKGISVHVACDVNNPMTGKNGSAAIYGPQKGATPAMVRALDAGLRNLCCVVRRDLGKEIERFPGAGAAGGLGGGLMAFLGARLKPGIEIMLEMSRFDSLLKGADFVITGEGQIDHQSVRNKAPVGVAHAARRFRIPVIGICGRVGKGAELTYAHGISAIFSIVPGPCTLEEALLKGRENMEITGENIARLVRRAKLQTGRP